jgi:trk system potassium uptake protein
MNARVIFYYLGWFAAPIAAMSLCLIIFTYFSGNTEQIHLYYFALLASSSLFILSHFFKSDKILNKIDLLIFMLLGFIIYPAIITIPYYFSYYQLNFFLAYYESFSGFLGYGFSIFKDPGSLNDSFLLWRSGSQWLGGFYYLFITITILSSLKINFLPTKYISDQVNSLNFENKFLDNFYNILYSYIIFSLLVLLLLNLTNLNFFEKLNLMMTIVSSGGFYIKEHLLLSSKIDSMIVASCFLLSSLNIFIFHQILKKDKNFSFNEDLKLIIFVFVISFLLLAIFPLRDDFNNIFLLVTTSISTSGIAIGKYTDSYFVNIFLVLTFIGGSIYSTGSGFKFMRMIFFIKKFLIEIVRLLSPSAIIKKTIFNNSETIKTSDFYIASLIFVFYVVFLLIAILLLSFDNLSFEQVYKLAFLSLNNTLPSNYIKANLSFYDLSYVSHFSILFLVFLSKIHFITILVIIKKVLWK